MEPQSFGSFGNIAPDKMAAIQEALARRQGGDKVPALDTQSGASPTPSPLPAEPSGNGLAQPETLPTPTQPSIPQGNPEAKMIISALRERLKAISATEVPPGVL